MNNFLKLSMISCLLIVVPLCFSTTGNCKIGTQVGDDINGEAEFDESGYSVSLSADGSTVAIGAPRRHGKGSNSGHVRIYENVSNVWYQIGDDIDGEADGDLCGNSVSLNADGSTVAIGAPWNNGNGSDSGHVRVFKVSNIKNSP